jgi:hypothetical protein
VRRRKPTARAGAREARLARRCFALACSYSRSLLAHSLRYRRTPSAYPFSRNPRRFASRIYPNGNATDFQHRRIMFKLHRPMVDRARGTTIGGGDWTDGVSRRRHANARPAARSRGGLHADPSPCSAQLFRISGGPTPGHNRRVLALPAGAVDRSVGQSQLLRRHHAAARPPPALRRTPAHPALLRAPNNPAKAKCPRLRLSIDGSTAGAPGFAPCACSLTGRCG